MKNITKQIGIFLSYFFYEFIIVTILALFNINYFTLNYMTKIYITCITNALYMIFLIFMYKKELKEDIQDFKKNYKSYLLKYIGLYILGVFLMMISNIVIGHFIGTSVSNNEIELRKLINDYPIYMFLSTCIFAPFIEEMIFRKTVKKILINKYAFIIISGLIFGALHITDFTDYKQLLLGISYIIMGIDFAYIYHKTNNIFTTMTFHFMHNLILFIIQIL